MPEGLCIAVGKLCDVIQCTALLSLQCQLLSMHSPDRDMHNFPW